MRAKVLGLALRFALRREPRARIHADDPASRIGGGAGGAVSGGSAATRPAPPPRPPSSSSLARPRLAGSCAGRPRVACDGPWARRIWVPWGFDAGGALLSTGLTSSAPRGATMRRAVGARVAADRDALLGVLTSADRHGRGWRNGLRGDRRLRGGRRQRRGDRQRRSARRRRAGGFPRRDVGAPAGRRAQHIIGRGGQFRLGRPGFRGLFFGSLIF